MLLSTIELRDFRNYTECHLELAAGTTVLVGANGQGKTNLLEAVGYLATLSSFRGAQDLAMVRNGAHEAIVRAEGERDGRRLLIEAEIRTVGRNRTQVNRQPLQRTRDLLGALRVSVFAPDDLDLIKGSPSVRRRFVDELAVAVEPALDSRRVTYERILRQRNALLKQTRGRLDPASATTLEVWDAKMIEAGEALGRMRTDLVDRLGPNLTDAYDALAGSGRPARVAYAPRWLDTGLADALVGARDDDLRRGVSTVGPHRDEIDLMLGAEPARTHASQGEQRTFALALRLGGHRMVTSATGSAPVLLLDDVFSELDARRRAALLENLPVGQTLLTTAADVPPGTDPEHILTVADGTIA